MYQPAIDLAAVTAIDMHVHIEVDADGHTSLPEPLVAAASRYFRTDGPRPAVDAVAGYYRERGMAAVVFTVDARTQLAHPPLSSVDIARAAADHADVLIPFGSVDPRTGEAALDLAARLVREEGVRGFKFHPTVQGFDPSQPEYAPLWRLIADLGVPALFHTGQTGIGAGLPGGYGLRLGLSNPMLLDVVAAEVPDLRIVMAHPSVPWQDEALAVATHKPNTWIDLSGWSPKYFPANLVRYANSMLKERVLFGTDYPLLTPDRWLRDVAATDLKADVLPGILKDNAARLVGLTARGEG
ncbi:amidohydrolase family protein [Asanoa sp. WMMD1127]|uniref:amidohydrolase family protein n=1 Tax=Asanoa sp. WMMD1127 TaxID=3016107 RepID=UPI002416D20B|nr:amidohydrolase family protein [Asanoa sp. WMMD1127]MDG4825159.1 amidohydrolase family protein [Asanoa sp. WMMD1127]